MKRLLLVIFLSTLGFGQVAARFGDGQPVQKQVSVPGVSAFGVFNVPGATVTMCLAPAINVPCTNPATTYKDRAESGACATNQQIVLAGTTSCVTNSDSTGHWGMWLDTTTNGGQYEFTITYPTGQSLGPFPVTVGGGTSTGSLPFIDVGPLTGTGGSDMLAKFKTCEALAALYVTNFRPTICNANSMNGAQPWTGSQTFSAVINMQYVIGPNTFIARNSGVIATFTMDGTQLLGAGKGAGLPTVSYTSPLVASTLGTTVIDGQAWSSGNSPAIRWQVNKGVIDGLTIIGDRVSSGDTQADAHGGDCIQDSNLHTDNIFRNLYLANCGHSGLSLQAADRDLFENITIEQSSEVGFLLNAADGLVHHDNTFLNTFCFDCNTSGFGASGNYNIISSGGFGNQQDVKMINPVVRGQLGSRTPANADLSLRSQSFQGIQVLGVNGLLIQNAVQDHTRAECIAISGENVEVAGGRLHDCAQAGGGGAGCVAIYSATQAVTYNYNLHDYDCEDSGYGVALLLGSTTPANQDGNILRDIHIHHLNLHTLNLGTPLVNGINISNNTPTSTCGQTTTVGATPPGVTVVIASATGYAIGQSLQIAGAGVAGALYVGNMTNVVGTTLTVTPATSTNVANGTAVARQCSWTFDNVKFDHISITDAANPIRWTGNSPAGAAILNMPEFSDVAIRDTGTGYVEECIQTGVSPLNCASAERGTVTVAAGVTQVVVQTTRVQENSHISCIDDGSKASRFLPTVIVCNVAAVRACVVNNIVPRVSFTLTLSAAPAVNPACETWKID